MAIDTQRVADYTFALLIVGIGIGILQIGLLVFQNRYTGMAAKAAMSSAEHVLRSERAYVDMSPKTVTAPIVALTPVDVVIVIKNYGRTPANVTNAALIVRISDQALPDAFPAIAPEEDVRGWIQPGGAIKWSPDYKLSRPLSREVADTLNDPDTTLKCWIIGWLDYTDRFGTSTRHRFTRRYSAKGKHFVLESQPGYNGDYDPKD